MKRFLKLAGYTLVVTLVLGEGLLRLVRLPLPDRFFQPHAEYGWGHIPGREGVQATFEYRTEVAINSAGLRDTEHDYERPAGAARILVLGDSFPEGLQVELEETVGKQLEAVLNAGGPQAVEVINGGVSRFSTANELLFYRAEGRKYAPDVVILFFFRNDLLENAENPFFELVDGELIEVIPRPVEVLGPAENLRGRLWDLSYLYRFGAIFVNAFGVSAGQPAGAGGPYDPVYLRALPPEVERGWALTHLLLDALRREVEADGARFFVVGIADTVALDPAGVSAEYDTRQVNARLSELCADLGIPALDLLPGFAERVAVSSEPLFWPNDGHWNPAGHRLAAGLLAQFLRDQGPVGR